MYTCMNLIHQIKQQTADRRYRVPIPFPWSNSSTFQTFLSFSSFSSTSYIVHLYTKIITSLHHINQMLLCCENTKKFHASKCVLTWLNLCKMYNEGEY